MARSRFVQTIMCASGHFGILISFVFILTFMSKLISTRLKVGSSCTQRGGVIPPCYVHFKGGLMLHLSLEEWLEVRNFVEVPAIIAVWLFVMVKLCSWLARQDWFRRL